MLIDGFILSIIGYLLFGTGASYSIPKFSMSWGPLLLSALYFIVQEGGKRNATLGKRVMGIRITSKDDSAFGLQQAAIRYFGKLLSALILLIGYIIALFDAEKRALHDRIAGSLVIKE